MKSMQLLAGVLMSLLLILSNVDAAQGDSAGAGTQNDSRGNQDSRRDDHRVVDPKIDGNQSSPIQSATEMINGAAGMTNCPGEYA